MEEVSETQVFRDESGSCRSSTAPSGATVFLRGETGHDVLPLRHRSSLTLRDLVENHNISSVLECDAERKVRPRAVVLDSPSDVLHSGKYYIARRDAMAEARGSCVTFRGKILVKEYELEHPTPLPSSHSEDSSVASCVPVVANTPFSLHGYTDDMETGCTTARSSHSFTDNMQTPAPLQQQLQAVMDEDMPGISRALSLSSDRKRPRDGAMSAPTTSTTSTTENNERCCCADRPPPAALNDCTNTTGIPTGKSTTDGVSSGVQRPLRFIPFMEAGADGSESLITLDDLQLLCCNIEKDEEDHQRRHQAATEIFESARRVLFGDLNSSRDEGKIKGGG